MRNFGEFGLVSRLIDSFSGNNFPFPALITEKASLHIMNRGEIVWFHLPEYTHLFLFCFSRLSRGDKGNLFILKMVDPSYRVPVAKEQAA